MKLQNIVFVVATLILSGILLHEASANAPVLSVKKLTDGKVLQKITKDSRATAKDGIPDGKIDRASKGADIVEAWYSSPTSRYRHGALGDYVEGGSLKVRTADGKVHERKLPTNEVFEDMTPRIVDLNGDKKMEVVTIRASQRYGAAITVYSMSNGNLIQRATTDFIGTPNRWLNIAGIGHFAGTKAKEIAFVDRPHLKGELKFLRLDRRNQLLLITRATRFSNHIYGAVEQRLSAMTDINGNGRQELVIPDFSRQKIAVLELSKSGLKTLAIANLPGRLDKAIGTRIVGKKTQILVGLDDGSVFALEK